MADGTPELPIIRCGEEIARLRKKKRWSRARLVGRMYKVLDEADLPWASINESWLARLEEGRVVKLPRWMIEVICRALE
jgi:transcriptional regulator with XRE-family HTH domain